MLTVRTATLPAAHPRHNAAVMGLAPVQRFTIGDGDQGTAQTIERIRTLVREGMTDQLVNRTAIAIVQRSGVQQFDWLGEIRAIYEWVLGNVRFVRDVFNIETLRTAREILLVRAGDCDDINSILLPSLLSTIGAHVRLVTISANPEDPKAFSHIYCEVELPSGQWLPLDAARRNPAFGRGPQNYFRKRVWSLTEASYRDMRGLGGYFRSMGDFEDIASGISDLIGAGGTATANIIRALNVPQAVPPGYAQNPVTGQLVPLNPNGSLVATSQPGSVFASASGSIPTWAIYGGIAMLFVMVMKK
jgi:hypothetical protein